MSLQGGGCCVQGRLGGQCAGQVFITSRRTSDRRVQLGAFRLPHLFRSESSAFFSNAPHTTGRDGDHPPSLTSRDPQTVSASSSCAPCVLQDCISRRRGPSVARRKRQTTHACLPAYDDRPSLGTTAPRHRHSVAGKRLGRKELSEED